MTTKNRAVFRTGDIDFRPFVLKCYEPRRPAAAAAGRYYGNLFCPPDSTGLERARVDDTAFRLMPSTA